MVVVFSRIGQMSPADCQSLGGSKAWMSRSDTEVVALAVAPRLLDRVFRCVAEFVVSKTEGKQTTRGEKSAHQTPMFCPQTSSRTQATADRQRSNPGIPPPVLELLQRSVRGQRLSHRFAGLVSKSVAAKTEGKQLK